MEQGKTPHRAWMMLAACCLLQAGGAGILINCAGIFFPPVCAELGFKTGEISMYLTIRGLACIFTLPLAGKWLGQKDLKKFVPTTAAIAALSFLVMGFYNHLWQWYLSGLVFGLACSFYMMTVTPVVLKNWFHKKAGFALGFSMAFAGLAGIILNPVGTAIILRFGWRTAYIILGSICFLFTVPVSFFVLKRSPVDVGLLPYGYEEEVPKAEAKKETAALPVQFSFTLLLVLICIAFMAFVSTYTNHFPTYAVSMGLSAGFGATMSSVSMMGNLLSKLGMGVLNDKMSSKYSTSLALGVIGFGLVLMVFSGGNTAVLLFAALCVGVCPALIAVSMPMLVGEVFGGENYSKYLAYGSMSSYTFNAVSVSTIGFMYDFSGSYTQSFLLGTGICLLGILCLWWIFQRKANIA